MHVIWRCHTLQMRFLFLWIVFLAYNWAHAQPAIGVPIQVHVYGQGEYPGNFLVEGTFLPSTPNGNDGFKSILTDTPYYFWGEGTSLGTVWVEVGKRYTIAVGGDNYIAGTATITAPQGYRVMINDIPRTTASVVNEVTISILPKFEYPALAGMVTEVSNYGGEWTIALGTLPNGKSAGSLRIMSQNPWTANYSLENIFCEPGSDEVQVVRGGNSLYLSTISSVVAPQVSIVVQPQPNNLNFDLVLYQPGVSSAYLVYEVRPGQITRKIGPPMYPIRTEVMTVGISGTVPNQTWTKSEWTLQGASPLREVVTQSVGQTNGRTETISVRIPSGTTALSLARTFTNTNAGEVLTGETAGTNLGLTGSFSYSTDTSDFGNLGMLKDATLPGGRWMSREYYSTASGKGGRVKYEFRPFLDAPITITNSPSQGEVVYHEWVADEYGTMNKPSLIQKSVNGVVVSKSTFTYNYSYTLPPTYTANTLVTRTDYTSSGNQLVSTQCYYGVGTSILAEMPIFALGADDLQTSYGYTRGTWANSVFTPGTSGKAMAVTTVSGVGTLSGGAVTLSVGHPSYPLGNVGVWKTIYVVPGKSQMSVTIRDERGLFVRSESLIFDGSAWRLVGSETRSNDVYGNVVSVTKHNGATSSATYSGMLKMSDTDEQGISTSYTYDVAGRVISEVRSGFGGVGSVTTTYTYDAMNRVLTKTRSGFGTTEQLVTTNQYDDAGRMTTETPPGLGSTVHTYDPANRTHTVTRPDGSTTIDATYRDGRVLSKTGSGVVAEYMTYGVESDGRSWTRKDVGIASSPRWEKAWTDWMGKPLRKERPGFTGQANIVEESLYETTTGRLYKTTKTGFAPTRFEYDRMGNVIRNGLDVNDNGLELASSDRITEKESFLESYGGAWWMKTEERKYTTTNNGTASVVGTTRQRLSGFAANRLAETQTIDADGNVTIETVDVDRATRTSVKTTSRTGISATKVETSLNGFPSRSLDFDGLVSTMTYDGLLRPKTVTDSRGNTTSTTYITGTELKSTVKDATNQTVASFGYDSSGRVIWQADALGHLTRTAFNLRGQVYRQWGGGTYPVEYGYDSTYGDRLTLSTFRAGTGWDGSTWPSSPGTADTTTFAFDGPSGMMVSKTDAQSRASLYTYNNQAQLATREWARLVSSGPNSGQRVKTTYTYDSVTGEQTAISYNDGSTPALSYTYNRLGLSTSITDDTGSRQLDYNLATGALTSETLNSTFYGGRKLTIKRDQTNTGTLGRITGYQVGTASSPALDQDIGYGYENFSRFTTLSTGFANNSSTRTFRYGYEPDSYLLKTLSVDGSPFLVSRTYEDDRDLVTSIESKWTSSPVTTFTKFTYTYDVRSQRSSALQDGAAFADYGDATYRQFVYNGRGEVTAAVGYLGTNVTSTSQPLPGRRYEYGYDNIGNRQWANRTGVTGLRDDYTANSLNQYVTRENNTVSISGTADASAVVAVNGRNVTAGRQGKFWSDEVTVSNVLNAWRGPISVYATKPSGGNALLRLDSRTAQTAAILESFSYDLDGNMVSDGLWDYRWDAENRLTRMETTSVAQSVGVPHRILEFRYDYLGRRVQKRVINGTLSQEVSSRRFIYDGWNLIAEYTAPGGSSFGAIVRTFTWGLDIARSLSESGGVGALVQLADHATGKTFIPTYDGNGNIASMVNAATGSIAAAYEYSPYGEALRVEVVDVALADQPFRFSSKWTDDETGLLYYGRRYYDPRNGRFVGRDPIEEEGGFNLYGFCGNNGVNRWDRLGMDAFMSTYTYKDSQGNVCIGWQEGDRATGMEMAEASVAAANHQSWMSYADGAASSQAAYQQKVENARADLAAILGSTAVGAALGMSAVISANAASFDAQMDSLNWQNYGNAQQAISSYVMSGAAGSPQIGLQVAMIAGDELRQVIMGGPMFAANNKLDAATVNLEPGGGGGVAGGGARGFIRSSSSSSQAAGSAGGRGGAGPVAQGQAGVSRAVNQIQQRGDTITGREITLRAGNVTTRPDLMVRTANGRTIFVEVKNGPSAGPTSNQRAGFPVIEAGGAIPVGGNAAAAGLPVGQPLPPTPVEIIKYD